MRSGQERRSKPPRAHRPSTFPPPPIAQPSLGETGGGGGGRGGEERISDALIELEEHSFRLPLTLPSERHVKSSILPPPPPSPTLEDDERALRELRHHDHHDGSLQPADDTRDEDDEAARERERLRLARHASMQRWALLVTAPLAIVAIAAIVRATVIWGRTPALDVNAANVATATAVATAVTPPVIASATPQPPPPPGPEPPAPSPKTAPPEAAPIVVTAEEQIARDRAAAKKEKFEAQAALECGDGRRAQRAAKRATALDPSDAQGWLLLVAAELDCKNPVAANEALRSCLTVATRGPKGECVGMVTGRAARAKKTMDVKTLSSLEPPDMPNGAESSSLPATPPPAPTR